MADTKQIKYINKTFPEFKQNLVQFAKNYFPSTYNDFTDASPGTMFIEMAAYVGDVLSFYTDYTLKENMLQYASERKNLLNIAQSFGYKPKISVASSTDIEVYQLLPSINTSSAAGINSRPDYDYALTINSGMEVQTQAGTIFRTMRDVNFRESSSLSPTEVTIYQLNAVTGAPEYYLLKKMVPVVSGEPRTLTITINEPKKNLKIKINDDNIIGINSVTDSDGNNWYEVPFLAQDTIYEDNVNNFDFDPLLEAESAQTPYILSLKKTARRFVTRITTDNKLELQFGSGISSNSDISILPNTENVGSNLPASSTFLDTAFDPSNFLLSRTYGQVPSTTTLTINYSVGYGLAGNVSSNTINTINSKTVTLNTENTLNSSLLTIIQNSIQVNNSQPATGGKSEETLDEIRQNALAYFATQNRAVTREDYIIRTYSLPPKYGSVAKAYITADQQVIPATGLSVANPFALNLYVLGYDSSKNLTNVNRATKENLRNYLSQYRILTDAVNIKNGYIINLGIDFKVVVLPGRNSREVILKCIQTLKELFSIDRMQFRQPIFTKDLVLALASTDGVQSVIDIKFTNKWKTVDGYSGNRYNLAGATREGIIYPSLDPSVFEIKYPERDIRGQAVTY